MTHSLFLKKAKIRAKVEDKQEAIALPLDYSFFQIKTPAEILRFPSRIDSPLSLKTPKDAEGKWLTTALKLNKNILEDLVDLPRVVSSLFPSEQWLTWLDLSCNLLHRVPPELLQLTSLKILCLHGNKIATTRELVKLQPLKNLIKLTAHGNPAELETGYFITVLAALPSLLKIDFTAVSTNERLAAEQLQNSKRAHKR
ncbi:Leucine-rich repeat-containing protein 51 [Echinococcus granulosus]|uniref:Leucine rich repeat containing protein 51 n=1 Tax=Echinococcus granulosus TaxID=6210 RepID=A0A068WK57_ECHGR|nr:Leucine-rich repeat-containing protein 51 [Echinococcus granulosus]CDS20493.1 leucine rich repeat containing protein 51 [Echinococcus granulosus]